MGGGALLITMRCNQQPAWTRTPPLHPSLLHATPDCISFICRGSNNNLPDIASLSLLVSVGVPFLFPITLINAFSSVGDPSYFETLSFLLLSFPARLPSLTHSRPQSILADCITQQNQTVEQAPCLIQEEASASALSAESSSTGGKKKNSS